MNITRSCITAGVLIGFACCPALAGRLDESLAELAKQNGPDETVRVWIKMADNHDAAGFKRSISREAATRAERHRRAYTRLRQATAKQQSLLARLGELKSQKRATFFKSHWIVNMVEAEVALGELERLAARADIDLIQPVPQIESIAPIYSKSPSTQAADASTVRENLTKINAPAAWAQGFTGAGRVVCSFDSGVLGSHKALTKKWKGEDGDSAAAWFDPLDQEPYPHTFPEAGMSFSHGTMTMGTMVGEFGPDTVGVAFGAKWISAAVVDIPGASVIDAFEWAADPDGNPNTVADVPDVINHSWGFIDVSCANILYDAIDNTEALGIVNIFSAGNEGSAAMSIRNPADRALDSIDCFAVGAWNQGAILPDYPTPIPMSSRGPSSCDLTATKPNVIAPGQGVYSTNTDGEYYAGTGTSMAAPHVSGLVAMLRQSNPDATVAQIKTAILNSTQRENLIPFPNNDVGWGPIDCMAALNMLPPGSGSPNIRVYDFSHAPIMPGDTVTGTVVLQNLGADAFNVSAELTPSNEALTIIDGSASFGDIFQGDTVRSGDPISVIVSDTVTEGSVLSLSMMISGDNPYFTSGQLHFLVEPPLRKAMATHDLGRVQFSLSNYGVLGMGAYSIFPLGGAGFKFDGGSNDLYEGGLMVGDHPTRVSSGVHDLHFDPDMDFKVAPGGNIVLTEPGATAAQETHAVFNDSNAKSPLGVEITQESFASNPPDDDYIVIRYIIKNVSPAVLSGLHLGLFLDWDAGNAFSNAGGFETDNGVTWIAYNGGSETEPVLSIFRGVKLLDGELATAGTPSGWELNIYPRTAMTPGNGLPTEEKYRLLTSGMLYADQYKSAKDDLFMVVAAGPITLPVGGRDTVSFALMAGNTLAEISDAALRARSILTDVEEPDIPPTLPARLTLYQNYPNPFNPTTRIAFDLPRRGTYELTISNVLGQTVHRQRGSSQAGRVMIDWDGREHASGIYFYTVTSGNYTASRKMMLLK